MIFKKLYYFQLTFKINKRYFSAENKRNQEAIKS